MGDDFEMCECLGGVKGKGGGGGGGGTPLRTM